MSFLFIVIIFILIFPDPICPTIIRRSQWTTVPAGDVNYLIVPLPYVVIQHTVTPECDTRETCGARVDSIRGNHMDVLGWDDIGYS